MTILQRTPAAFAHFAGLVDDALGRASVASATRRCRNGAALGSIASSASIRNWGTTCIVVTRALIRFANAMPRLTPFVGKGRTVRGQEYVLEHHASASIVGFRALGPEPRPAAAGSRSRAFRTSDCTAQQGRAAAGLQPTDAFKWDLPVRYGGIGSATTSMPSSTSSSTSSREAVPRIRRSGCFLVVDLARLLREGRAHVLGVLDDLLDQLGEDILADVGVLLPLPVLLRWLRRAPAAASRRS